MPQIENLLLSGEGVIKLCDFGSATTQQVNPDPSWSATQRGLAEDEVRDIVCIEYRRYSAYIYCGDNNAYYSHGYAHTGRWCSRS